MNNYYFNEVIRINGRDYRVRKSYDHSSGPPWDECDGHGPIREIRRDARNLTNDYRSVSKAPGEVLIDNGNGELWAYNVQAATKMALRDAWGHGADVAGETKRQKAARAVAADVKFCQDWLRNEWWWCSCAIAFESDFQREGEGCEWDYLGSVEDGCDKHMSAYSDPEQPHNVWVEQMIPDLTYDRRKAWRKALAKARADRSFEQANRMLECAN